MAIAYSSSAGLQSNSGTSHTFPITCGGADRFLVVYPMTAAARSISSVTYAGTGMTFKVKTTTGGQEVHVYYLANPATGENNVVVTTDASTYCYPTAVSYTGVDQTTPTGASGNSNGTTPSLTLTTTAADSWLVMGVRDGSDGATTAGADTTQRWSDDTQAYDRSCGAAGNYTIAVANLSTGNSGALAGMVINASVSPDPSTIYIKGRPRNRYDFTGISLG